MKSYVTLAKLKEDELGDLADQFELFRMNDHAFQQLISDGMGNIFHKIMQLNIRDVRSKDLVVYIKLKFQQAVEITDQKDVISLDVRDKVLSKRKEVKINQMMNLEKAF